MIRGLIGKIHNIENNELFFNVNGVIYQIYISENTKKHIIDLSKELDFYIDILEKISEVGYDLYGFIDMDEKRLFEKIIKIPKVGNKIALNVFNEFSPIELIEKISIEDKKELKKIKGFGEKGIVSLINQLKDESIDIDKRFLKLKDKLIELGLKKEDFNEFIKNKKDMSDIQIVKEYLKNK